MEKMTKMKTKCESSSVRSIIYEGEKISVFSTTILKDLLFTHTHDESTSIYPSIVQCVP